MGVLTWATHSYVIGYEKLKRLCEEEVNAIEATPYFKESGWNCYARAFSGDYLHHLKPEYWSELAEYIDESVADHELQRVATEITELLIALGKAFHDRHSLSLSLASVPEDDTVGTEAFAHDECMFIIDGASTLTPAGNALSHMIEEVSWVTYG